MCMYDGYKRLVSPKLLLERVCMMVTNALFLRNLHCFGEAQTFVEKSTLRRSATFLKLNHFPRVQNAFGVECLF